MKIVSDFNYEEELGERLKSGDIVYMKGSNGTGSFYGLYSLGVGVIELENGSSTYAQTNKELYLGSKISYWTVAKIFRNCELKIKE